MRGRLVIAAAVTAALAACTGRTPTGPTLPSTVTLGVRYVQSTNLPPAFADPSCPHHSAPLNMTLTTSWGESVRLQPQDDGTFAGVVTAEPGQRWMRLIDIAWCGSANGALAAEGLWAGGVELTRFEVVDDGIPAFVFTVSETGRVTP